MNTLELSAQRRARALDIEQQNADTSRAGQVANASFGQQNADTALRNAGTSEFEAQTQRGNVMGGMQLGLIRNGLFDQSNGLTDLKRASVLGQASGAASNLFPSMQGSGLGLGMAQRSSVGVSGGPLSRGEPSYGGSQRLDSAGAFDTDPRAGLRPSANPSGSTLDGLSRPRVPLAQNNVMPSSPVLSNAGAATQDLFNRTKPIGAKRGTRGRVRLNGKVVDPRGGPKHDTVPAKLAAGEAVLNAGAAAQLGDDAITHLNEMGASKMGLRGGPRMVGGKLHAMSGFPAGADVLARARAMPGAQIFSPMDQLKYDAQVRRTAPSPVYPVEQVEQVAPAAPQQGAGPQPRAVPFDDPAFGGNAQAGASAGPRAVPFDDPAFGGNAQGTSNYGLKGTPAGTPAGAPVGEPLPWYKQVNVPANQGRIGRAMDHLKDVPFKKLITEPLGFAARNVNTMGNVWEGGNDLGQIWADPKADMLTKLGASAEALGNVATGGVADYVNSKLGWKTGLGTTTANALARGRPITAGANEVLGWMGNNLGSPLTQVRRHYGDWAPNAPAVPAVPAAPAVPSYQQGTPTEDRHQIVGGTPLDNIQDTQDAINEQARRSAVLNTFGVSPAQQAGAQVIDLNAGGSTRGMRNGQTVRIKTQGDDTMFAQRDKNGRMTYSGVGAPTQSQDEQTPGERAGLTGRMAMYYNAAMNPLASESSRAMNAQMMNHEREMQIYRMKMNREMNEANANAQFTMKGKDAQGNEIETPDINARNQFMAAHGAANLYSDPEDFMRHISDTKGALATVPGSTRVPQGVANVNGRPKINKLQTVDDVYDAVVGHPMYGEHPDNNQNDVGLAQAAGGYISNKWNNALKRGGPQNAAVANVDANNNIVSSYVPRSATKSDPNAVSYLANRQVAVPGAR